MSLPTWVSKKNLALHTVLGVLLAVVLTYHGPLNGVLDVATIVAGSALYLLWTALT